MLTSLAKSELFAASGFGDAVHHEDQHILESKLLRHGLISRALAERRALARLRFPPPLLPGLKSGSLEVPLSTFVDTKHNAGQGLLSTKEDNGTFIDLEFHSRKLHSR